MALSLTVISMDGQIRHRVSRAEKRHGDGGRIGKTIRQQIDKLSELCRRGYSEPRRKIVDLFSNHPAG